MIFVTVGSQKFPFDRLLREIDRLKEHGELEDEVFAQTGHSSYQPRYYEGAAFLGREQFREKMKAADLVITHGGTGAIIQAVKQGKKVVAVPRKKEYGEHVDDHQMQIVGEFAQMDLLSSAYEVEELGNAVREAKRREYRRYESSTELIVESIREYIENI